MQRLQQQFAVADRNRNSEAQSRPVEPKSVSAVLSALRKCGSTRDLATGRRIHADSIQSGHNLDAYVVSALVNMYARCGSMRDARMVLNDTKETNVVSWTALINGYARNGEAERALEVFVEMQQRDCAPCDPVTYLAVLKACSILAAREEGRQIDGKLVKLVTLEKIMAIHSQAAASGCTKEQMKVVNALVDAYARCGSLRDAKLAFDSMERKRDAVPWTTLMLGCIHNGESKMALELFLRMKASGCKPDHFCFVAALKACSSLAKQEKEQVVGSLKVKMRSLEQGMAVHAWASREKCTSGIYVANALVDLYAKCGSLEDAARMFDSMSEQTLVSWNVLILGYAQNGDALTALRLFSCMLAEGCAPDRVTFLAALKACSNLACREANKEKKLKVLNTGMAVHRQVVKYGLGSETKVACSLVDMYAKCGSLQDAWMVFSGMKYPPVVAWNALLFGYVHNDEPELALNAFAAMKSRPGCTPDAQTYLAVIKACSLLAVLKLGKAAHAEVVRVGIDQEELIATSVVTFYGKCGSITEAEQVFNSMDLTNRSCVPWNALLAGYSNRGDVKAALDCLHRMREEGVLPDEISLLEVMVACSESNLVDTGQAVFDAIAASKFVGVSPTVDHYNCMFEMLGRNGRKNEAVALLEEMPFEPSESTWARLHRYY